MPRSGRRGTLTDRPRRGPELGPAPGPGFGPRCHPRSRPPSATCPCSAAIPSSGRAPSPRGKWWTSPHSDVGASGNAPGSRTPATGGRGHWSADRRIPGRGDRKRRGRGLFRTRPVSQRPFLPVPEGADDADHRRVPGRFRRDRGYGVGVRYTMFGSAGDGCRDYSDRSVSTGFTRAARRAGGTPAAMVAANNSTTDTARKYGSR